MNKIAKVTNYVKEELVTGWNKGFKKGWNNAISRNLKFTDVLTDNPNSLAFAKEAQIPEDMQEDFRLFNLVRIASGGFMTIQGSSCHECSPQRTLPSEAYTHMTVGFLSYNAMQITRPIDSGINYKLANELQPYINEDKYFSNVPVELIQRLFKCALKQK